MDWFDLNYHLRLLRSTQNNQTQQSKNGVAQFPISGKRLETLKSLRKLLRKFPHRLNPSTTVSIFNVLKSILTELTGIYFQQTNVNNKFSDTSVGGVNPLLRGHSLAQINVTNKNVAQQNNQSNKLLKKTLSTENVFISSLRRNEILECIQIIIDLVSMKYDQSMANGYAVNGDHQSGNGQPVIEPTAQEDYFGRTFLPEIITLLGHESSDVQRNAIRFLQLYITRTNNLQRMMSSYIEHGLESPIRATKFGALNALPHLFVRNELRAENLGPVVSSLGSMLVHTQIHQPHIFYPTYVALERINSLIGSKRFYQYLLNAGDKAVTIYETVQKRAPSPQVYIDNTGFSSSTIDPIASKSKFESKLNARNVELDRRKLENVRKNSQPKQQTERKGSKSGQGLINNKFKGDYLARKISIGSMGIGTSTAVNNEETIIEEESEDITNIINENGFQSTNNNNKSLSAGSALNNSDWSTEQEDDDDDVDPDQDEYFGANATVNDQNDKPVLEQSASQQQTKTESKSSDYYKKEMMDQTEADIESRQENGEKLGNNHHKADYQTLKKMDYPPHHHHYPQQQPPNAYYPSYGEQRQMNNLKDNHAYTNHNHYDEGNSEENENNEECQESDDQQPELNNDVKYNKDMDQNSVRPTIMNNNINQEQEMIMEDTWNNRAMKQQQEFRMGSKEEEEETGDEDEVDTSETRDISVVNTNSANSANSSGQIKKIDNELATTTNDIVGEEAATEIGKSNACIIVEGPTVDTDIAQLLSRRKFSTDNNNNNNDEHHCQQQQSSPGKRLSMGTIHNNSHNSNNRRNSNTSSTGKQNYAINNAGMPTNKPEDDPGKALEVETDEEEEKEKTEDYLLISASGKELEKPAYPNQQQQVTVTEEVAEKDYSTDNNATEIDDEDDNVEDEEINEINGQLNNNKNNYNSYGFRRRPTETTDMLTGHSAAASVANKTTSSINPLTSSNVDDHHNNQYNINRRRSSNIKQQSQQQPKNKIIADNKNVLANEQSRSKKLTQPPGLNTNRQVTFVNGNDDLKIKKKKSNSNSSNLTNSSLLNTNAIKTTNSLKSNVSLQQSSDEDDQFQYHHNRFILDANNSLNNTRSTIKVNTNNSNSDLKSNDNMAATSFVSPSHQQGLASLAQLDADTLANLDYIPTMKDYYLPYYYPYYYDPLYHPTGTYAASAAAAAAAAAASNAHPHHMIRFGIFPRVLIYQSLSTIAEEQFAAVQAIVRIVRDVPAEHLLLLLPHMDEFLSIFVAQLLLDSSSNFKVILWTLDIIELLTERFKARIHPNLSQLVLLLSQRLGDNRIVIRDSVIKVFHQIMSRYSPQEMLDLLFKHVSTSQQHQQPLAFTSASKLREEMANRVTASLATFPRAQLNLPKLCFDIAPFLVDRRALVRLAALECVATLAQALGPHKLGSLMTAVHSLESSLNHIDFNRLIAAIQARLARRTLPRVGPDGNVQYVLRVPTSSESWYYRRIYDADLEWIALGPTIPPSNIPILNTPTIVPPLAPKFIPTGSNVMIGGDSSGENSSSEAPRTNNSTPAAPQIDSCQEERLARQQMSINSADSDDIPPPVKNKVIVSHSSASPDPDIAKNRNRSRSKPRKIDPDSMAQDTPSPMRNFSDKQQQRELENRIQSLENSNVSISPGLVNRSKTSQEYRPYAKRGKKRDLFIERLVRGESVDDSDLADAQLLRRSSIESLEAWRQYFGRFKNQLADISLSRPYGSRPSSSVYYGLSPLPPLLPTMTAPIPPAALLSPSYYYYYYIANGLSNSYHDLSQLQQKNMMSIMRRSGFLSDQDQQTQTDPNEEPTESIESMPKYRKSIQMDNDDKNANNSNNNPKNNPNTSSPNRKYSQGVNEVKIIRTTRFSENPDSDNLQNKQETLSILEPEPIQLERSFSMPSIRTDSSTETDQLINTGSHHQNSQDQPQISDEVIMELDNWEQVIQEEKNQQSNTGNQSSVVQPSAPEEELIREERRLSMQPESFIGAEERAPMESSIPTVNIQPSTPAISMNAMDSPKSERPPLPNTKSGYNEEDEYNNENTNQSIINNVEPITKRRESMKEVNAKQISNNEASISNEGSNSNDDNKQNPNLDFNQQSSAQSLSNPGGGKPAPKPPAVSKTGPPAPPSRRLSRPPQQLYIKTTPAIPMNANIQHILGNVARTEGPFENAYEAVKAALIALRDHAWTTKVEGMLAIVRLATFHPHHLIRDQHQISLALASETRNLRSTVARSAIFTIGELFSKLRLQIEPEMDIMTQALLTKVSENSVFIREDIDRALQLMVDSMPATRAALSLITHGSGHRNTHVRRTSAQFLSLLVEKMGPMKCLLGPRDIGEHLLPAAAKFIQDHSAHTRYFGRRIFAVLMQHPLFDKFLRRHVSPGTYRNICGMLETIKRRGIGDAPSDLYSPTVQPKHSDPRRLVVVEGVTTPA